MTNYLFVKRRSDNIQFPGIWELPGGRLELGEDPFEGLKREMLEEVNKTDFTIVHPLNVRHFTRKDKQIVTLIIFYCETESEQLTMDEELAETKWVPLSEAKEHIDEWYLPEIELYEKLHP